MDIISYSIARKATEENKKRKFLSPINLRPLPTLIANPPTVTLGAENAAKTIVGGTDVTVLSGDGVTPNPIFNYIGSKVKRADWNKITQVYDNTAGLTNMIKGALVTSHSAYDNLTLEFYHEGIAFEVRERAVTGAKYNIFIDEGKGYEKVFGTFQNLGATSGAYYYRKVEFAARKIRRIKLQYCNAPVGNITISANDTLWSVPKVPKVKAVWFGDSNIEGTGADAPFAGFAPLCSEILGWDCFISGFGSTGYSNQGQFSVKRKYIERVDADCIELSPDIVVIAGGNNDTTIDINTVNTDSLAFFNKLKTELPNTFFIVQGNMAKQNPALPAQTAVRDVLKANALAVGFPFIDTIAGVTYDGKGNALNTPTGNWFTGYGNITNVQSYGNASIYVIADNAHCSQAGYDYLTQRMVYEIMNIIA